MRPNLLETFRSGKDQDYTYQELLALQAAGNALPTSWLTRTRQAEEEARQQAHLQEQIAADLKAAEQAHATQQKALLDQHLPALQEKITELDSLREDEAQARQQARQAIKSYLQAHRASRVKYSEIARTVKDQFGDTVKDDEGNPLPGQTGRDNQGRPLINGQVVTPPALPTPWDDPAFNQSYFR